MTVTGRLSTPSIHALYAVVNFGLTVTVGVAVVAVSVTVVHTLSPAGILKVVAVAGCAVGKPTVSKTLCVYVTTA